jgi:hypothetical protein
MARYVPQPVAVKELLAAAFYAQRTLGGLNKNNEVWDETAQSLTKVTTNKEVILRVLKGELLAEVQDYEAAETAKDALLLSNTLRLLKGGALATGFQSSMYTLLEKDMDTVSAAGLVAYAPNMYEMLQKREVKQETIAELAITSEYLGKVGEKVTFVLTVMEKRYLQQFNCFSVTGTDANGNLINFLTAKEDCTVSAKYSGKIKKIEESKWHSGARVTNLNFVKKL